MFQKYGDFAVDLTIKGQNLEESQSKGEGHIYLEKCLLHGKERIEHKSYFFAKAMAIKITL